MVGFAETRRTVVGRKLTVGARRAGLLALPQFGNVGVRAEAAPRRYL